MRELALHRRIALAVFCAAMALACVELSLHHKDHEALAEVLAIIALIFWCTLDARMHGKVFQHGWVVPFMATWPVAMAIHLVWTRGWRLGSKVYGAVLGVAFILTIILGITGVLPTHPR